MKIKINGSAVEVGDVASIADVVAKRALSPEKIVIEHNYRIISRDEWHKATVNENDNLEIVSFVGGG